MNAEQIEKLHTEAQNDLLAGAKAKNIDLQDIIALCQAAERTTSPVSLTDDDLTQEFSLDAIIKGIRYADHGRHEGWQAELKEYIRIECNRALLAAAPAPIQQDPQAAQLVTTTYAKAHSTTVIVNLVKGNVTTCLYSADHSANGKTIGVSDLPDGLSLAVKQSPETCGGCGETDPSKRCIGCCHPFSEPGPAVTMDPATPPALAGSQVQAAGDALDAARYRWLRDKARSVDWTRHLDANSYQIECRIGAVKMDTDIDAAMREKP